MRPSLTALSQTGEPSPDTDALTGLSADLDLHNRTPADSPDIRHEIKDQNGWAPNLSERAQLSGPFTHLRGTFLVPLGATLGATSAFRPPNRARLMDSAAARLSPSSK